MLNEKKYTKGTAKFLILFIPFLFGFFSYPLAILGFDLSYMPGDLGDARFINYVLEHGYQFIIGNRESFYDAPFFFPEKNVLALSDNMVGHLPIYSFFRIIRFSREDSLQLWWLSVFALNYFISFFCFYKYSNNFLAAVLTAYLFTFSILNLAQFNYLQINARFLLPVMLLYYLKWLSTNNARNLNVFLIVFFIQLLLGLYYAVFIVAFVLIISLVHVFLTKSFNPFTDLFLNLKKNKFTLLILFIVTVLSILYILPYMEVAKNHGVRKYSDINNCVLEWNSFISTPPSTIWSGALNSGEKYFPVYWLHQYFPGSFAFLIIITAVLFLLLKPRNILTDNFKLVFLTFIICFFISIKWWGDFSPLQFFYAIGLFGPIAVVSRIIFVADVLLLFIALNLFVKVFSLQNRYLRFVTFIFILSFIALDNHISKPDEIARVKKTELLKRYKKIEERISITKTANKNILAIVEEDKAKQNSMIILDAMLLSQKLGIASINGYSSGAPGEAGIFWASPTRKELSYWCLSHNIDSSKVIIIDSPN
jgi:hypothetical protein